MDQVILDLLVLLQWRHNLRKEHPMEVYINPYLSSSHPQHNTPCLSTLIAHSISNHPVNPLTKSGIREDPVPMARPKEKECVGFAPFAPARGHWGNDRGMGEVFSPLSSVPLWYNISCPDTSCNDLTYPVMKWFILYCYDIFPVMTHPVVIHALMITV